MRRKVWNILFAILVITIILRADENKNITMIFGHYPPFYLGVKEDLKTQVSEGMFIDFLEAFEKKYGYKINKVCAPRKRIDLMMEIGEARAFSLTNPMFVGDKADNYIWTDSIFYTKDVIISLKEKPLIFNKVEDLYGKKIGKVIGMGYGDLDAKFESGKIIAHNITGQNAVPRLVKMLKLGRIDGFFGNITAAPYRMKSAGLDPEDYYFAPKPLFEFDLMTQINKENKKLQKDMNEFIKESKENGFLKKIEEKWLR